MFTLHGSDGEIVTIVSEDGEPDALAGGVDLHDCATTLLEAVCAVKVGLHTNSVPLLEVARTFGWKRRRYNRPEFHRE